MILICYDGSVDARAAIKEAASLLNESAAILTVWHPTSTAVSGSAGGHAPVDGAGESDDSDRARLRLAARCAAEGAELARQAGIDAEPTTHAQRTNITQAILDEAERLGASAIVLGSRGRGGLKSALLGSVSSRVVEHADRPVIVVPSPAVAQARGHGSESRQVAGERAPRAF